jgi:hypothetical protein
MPSHVHSLVVVATLDSTRNLFWRYVVQVHVNIKLWKFLDLILNLLHDKFLE